MVAVVQTGELGRDDPDRRREDEQQRGRSGRCPRDPTRTAAAATARRSPSASIRRRSGSASWRAERRSSDRGVGRELPSGAPATISSSLNSWPPPSRTTLGHARTVPSPSANRYSSASARREDGRMRVETARLGEIALARRRRSRPRPRSSACGWPTGSSRVSSGWIASCAQRAASGSAARPRRRNRAGDTGWPPMARSALAARASDRALGPFPALKAAWLLRRWLPAARTTYWGMIAATASEREHRPERAEASPRGRALRGERPEGETEHPDTDDRYTRELPDPVVRGGREEGDAARGGRGDLSALQRERRADRADGRDEDCAADEQEADDSQLARAPRDRASARTRSGRAASRAGATRPPRSRRRRR